MLTNEDMAHVLFTTCPKRILKLFLSSREKREPPSFMPAWKFHICMWSFLLKHSKNQRSNGTKSPSVQFSSVQFIRAVWIQISCASVFACVNNKYFETVATVRKHNWPYRLKISHSYRTKKCKHCAKCLFALWAKAKISIHWLSEKVIQKTHKNVLCFIFDLKLVQRQ